MRNVKKLLIISTTLFFLLYSQTLATTGTCITENLRPGEFSTNCAFGEPSSCYYPAIASCSTESDYSQKKQAMSGINAVQGMGTSISDSSPALIQCRADIDRYQQQMSAYNICISNLGNRNSTYTPTPTQTQPASSAFDEYLKQQMDESKKFAEKTTQWKVVNDSCRQKHGGGAMANLTTFECECNTGYQFFDTTDATTNLPVKMCIDNDTASQIRALKSQPKTKNQSAEVDQLKKEKSLLEREKALLIEQAKLEVEKKKIETQANEQAISSTTTLGDEAKITATTSVKVKVPFYKKWLSWLWRGWQ